MDGKSSTFSAATMCKAVGFDGFTITYEVTKVTGIARTDADDETINYPLKLGAGTSQPSLKIDFDTSILIKSVEVKAALYGTDSNSSYVVTSDAYTTGTAASITSNTEYKSYTFDHLDNDNETYTKNITFKSSKSQKNNRIYLSEISFTYYVKNSSSSTVTYEYGNTLTNEDFSTKTEEVTKGETTKSPLTDNYTYSDWDGTRELVGWYTDEEKTKQFDFSSTIDSDITLYAKWKLTADSAEVTNIKTSETKSQLYYEYSNKTYSETTESVTFGETLSSSSKAASSLENFTSSDGIKISGISSSIVYQDDDKGHAVKMSSSSNSGSITFNFGSSIIIENVIVSAITFKTNEGSKISVSSSNGATTDAQSITATAFGTDSLYTFAGLDKGEKASSNSITLSATKRLHVSKVEFVIAKEGGTTSSYNITNIGLRFGGLVKKAYYDALKDHITNFGLIYAIDDLGEHETLLNALNDSSVTKTSLDYDAKKDNVPYCTEVDGEEYYVFSAFFNVASASINKVIYAIATLTFDNGNTIYFTEKSNSVVTIAKEYLNKYEFDEGAVKETLTMLSEGKTKVDTTEFN